MHFYKPATYRVKSFSILEQAVFLLGPTACCRFIQFNCESNRYLTTATLISATLGPEFNTTNLKKTKLVSKFHNFKISFDFTLKCSCQCKQSLFQFQRAAGHRSVFPGSGTPSLQSLGSSKCSFCQPSPEPGLQLLPVSSSH